MSTYTGPTFMPTADYARMQERRFEEGWAAVAKPSEPLRVADETAGFEDQWTALPRPSEELRQQHEMAAFEEGFGALTLPSQELAETFPPTAPAAPPQPVPVGSPGGDGPGESPGATDPVQATLAFLRGLGGDEQPTEPAVSPDATYPQPSAFAGLAQPEQLSAPAVPDPAAGPFAADPLERLGAAVAPAVASPVEEVGGAISPFVPLGRGVRDLAARADAPMGVMAGQQRDARAAEVGLTPEQVGRAYEMSSITLNTPASGYIPDPQDFAARMQYRKDLAAGQPSRPVPRPQSTGRKAEEAYYQERAATAANEPPAWDPEWAKTVAEPAGARPPDDDWFGSFEFGTLESEAEQLTRPELLAGMNRGDLLAQLKRLVAESRAGAQPTAETVRPSGSYRMPGGPVPEDVAQGRYQLPGVLGDNAPPPMPPVERGLRQGGLGGDLSEDLGGITAPRPVPWMRHVLGDQRDVIGAPANGEFGQQLAAMVHDVRDNAATMRGAWLDDARDALALDKPRFANLVDVLEGKAQPLDAGVGRAAGAVRTVFDQVYERARRTLPDVKAKIDDYFPHIFDPNEFKGEGYQRAVRHLIETGQAKTIAEAGKLVGKTRRYSSEFRKSGNLENAREVDYPFYLKTPQALMQHLHESARRISEAEMFGAKGELKDRIVAQIATDGGDAAAVERAFARALEQGEPPSDLARGASRAIRSVESAAHLGLSTLSNATQLANTAAVFGARRTAGQVRYALSEQGLREAVRAGVVDPATIANLKEGTGATRVLGMVTAPGMGKVEVVNRSATYHTAVDFANEMARKAPDGDKRAIAALDALGLDGRDVATRGLLTDAERVRAGRIGVERTQFYVDPQDLPGWASTPAGRIASQFRTFGYRQSRYIGRELLTPLMHGDPRPLLKYLAVATAVGVPVDAARDVLAGRDLKSDPVDIAVGGLARAGGFGLAGDVYRGTRTLATMPPEMAVARTVGLVGGPAVSDVANVVGGTAGLVQGNTTPMVRTALGMVPIAGPFLQNTIAPYKKREPTPYTLPGGTRNNTRDSRRTGRDSRR